MSKPLKPKDVTKHKKQALNQLDSLLKGYIEDSNPKHLKKANLISYWVENFTSYIEKEEVFEPAKLKRYERGDIIKANFGFNIGSEYGGLHYAIVLDKANARNSPVITVIPLTSYTEGDKIHENDVYLGHELYQKLSAKISGLKQNLVAEKQASIELNNTLQTLMSAIKVNITEVAVSNEDIEIATEYGSTTIDALFDQVMGHLANLEARNEAIKKQEYILNKASSEIAKMKHGSIALPSQITTISKQRIYDPKKPLDVLSGIKLSPEGLDKLSDGLKKLYFV